MKLRRFIKRQGNCYPISYAIISDNREWLLVHGIVNGSIEHAWLVKDDEVYDGVLNERMSEFDYELFFGAEIINIYSYVEAEALVIETGHVGPWNELERKAMSTVY